VADELKVVIKVDAGQAVAVLQKTDGEVVELVGDVGKLDVSLAQLEKAQKAVTASFKAAATGDARKAYALLDQQVKGAGHQMRHAAQAQEQFGRSSTRAGDLLFAFSQAAEDAQFGMRGVQNNIPQLLQGFARLSAETGGAGGAMKSLLGAATTLGGAVGLVGLGITLANVTGLTDKLAEAFTGAADRAREAKEQAVELFDEILTFEGSDFENEVVIQSKEQGQQVLNALGQQANTLRAEQQRLRNEAEALFVSLTSIPLAKRIQTEEYRQANEKLSESVGLAEPIAEANREFDAFRQRLEEFNRSERRSQPLLTAGGLTREAVKTQQQVERDAERSAEQARREAERAAEQAQRERERRTEQAIANEQAARITLIESEHERAIEAVRAQYAERIALAQSVGRDAQQLEAARDAEISRLNAERDAELLSGGQAVLRALEQENRQLFADESRRTQSLHEQQIENVLFFSALAARLGLDRFREAERQQQELARQAERELQQIERYLGRAFDGVANAFEGAIFGGDGPSDVDIELTRRRFEAEEEALRESLKNKELDQRDYHLRMRQLDEERSAFSKQVEAERAGFITNSLLALSDVAKQAALDVMKAEFVKAAAVQVRKVMEMVPFPLNLAVAPAAYLAVLGLQKGITSAAGLADGGPVFGPGGPREDRIPVWLSNGEHVLTAKAAQGQHAEIRQLNAMMERGLRVEDVLNAAGLRRADGGVIGLPSMSVPALPPARAVTPQAAPRPDHALIGELRALRRTVEQQGQRPARLVAERRTSRRLAQEAQRFDRAKDPRRR
jgi:hypothetical protein